MPVAAGRQDLRAARTGFGGLRAAIARAARSHRRASGCPCSCGIVGRTRRISVTCWRRGVGSERLVGTPRRRVPAAYRPPRSLKRWIFPVAVFGSSGTKSIQRGYL